MCDILAAAGLPPWIGELWVAEALIDDQGVTTYHVGTLGEALRINDIQVSRHWSCGYVPFALARTAAEAREICGRMRRKQEALAALDGDEQPEEPASDHHRRTVAAMRDFSRETRRHKRRAAQKTRFERKSQ